MHIWVYFLLLPPGPEGGTDSFLPPSSRSESFKDSEPCHLFARAKPNANTSAQPLSLLIE